MIPQVQGPRSNTQNETVRSAKMLAWCAGGGGDNNDLK